MTIDINRRTAAGVIAGGLAAVAATRVGAQVSERTQSMTGKIDTHQHYLPKIYMDAIDPAFLAAMTPNRQPPTWSVEGALQLMEACGTAEGILSLSAGPPLADPAGLLRKCNDYGTELRAKYPGRFGLFASLPLPNVDASLKEIAYSLDTLKADGFIIFSNYDGHYLGNPKFAPVFEELNRRKAVAFIHPTVPPYPQLQDQPSAGVLELPYDTTRTAVSLIYSGSLRTYPDIAFILSHAGGTLPFLSSRIGGGVMLNPALAERVGDFDEALRHFWYDTALSVSKPALAALLAVADPTKITFGTDYPFVPAMGGIRSAKALDHAPLDDKLRAGIERENAARLLGRAA